MFHLIHILFRFLLRKLERLLRVRSAIAKSVFMWMTRALHTALLVLCCSLLALQSWSCTEKFLSDPIAIKIYSTPLTPERTPSLTLCLGFIDEQYDYLKLKKYGLTLEGYKNKGIRVSNLTKEAGLSVEDVHEELINENFWLARKQK